MKISLCAVEQRLNDKEFNLKQIEKYASVEALNGTDMCVFGESFLQGFECLSFVYKDDVGVPVTKRGEIINNYRRMSPGWKEPSACSDYREGDKLYLYKMDGVSFSTLICGDFWDEDLYTYISMIDSDVLLWPVFVDFSVIDWYKNEFEDYRNQSQLVPMPVLFVNSFVDEDDRAKGGAYVFYQGKVVEELEMGKAGVLRYEYRK
ncbi:MAG: carbon-nitrogen hydrolase family protein [Finegoldia magna]|uniref:carbon-nitrogen hydrolase family protein n=1 Tax=Finegoldia magna TaxID=1260 RepID=UPI0026EE64E4|nr:carbon-nitrogen hydrolase family protein [Finegoldia magna]MBS5966793.1 carbon-nitrogen hydrolase family protein [Finegoldia magna]